ncbi:MAG: ABC transporter ATP-binding protein [Candidatus Marinimicrobia bacterium]|nr:ABC transporter ATP-binding protein [Candidatus Neomarinimicrobiota bacterium]
MAKPIINLENVSFRYNSQAVLENVNLQVEERDFLGILGPNGGGKTTLLKLILGLVKPQTGSITLFGGEPTINRHLVGYVPQLFNFDFEFPITVREVVLMGILGRRRFRSGYNKTEIELANKVLIKVGMESSSEILIGELSGGQRQRIFIARALATEPKLLLLDEPLANIDQQWQHSIYELLNDLNQEIAIVVVTHDVGIVSTYIDKIACLNRTMHFHGSTKDGIPKISEMYQCPFEFVGHEVPHRLLEKHDHD